MRQRQLFLLAPTDPGQRVQGRRFGGPKQVKLDDSFQVFVRLPISAHCDEGKVKWGRKDSSGQVRFQRLNLENVVIAHQEVGMDSQTEARRHTAEQLQEIPVCVIVRKQRSAVDSTTHERGTSRSLLLP